MPLGQHLASAEEGAMKNYLAAIVSLATVLSGHAETVSTGWWDGQYASGNWGRHRDDLAARGYTFFAYYNAIVASNVSGGIDQGTAYAHDVYAGMKVDLERLLGWKSTTFSLTGINRAGASINGDVGGIYSVMQLVGGQTTFLYGLNLEKKFLQDRLSVKLGRITATDDFAGSPLYGLYLTNSIDGQIRAVLLDGVMTSYPFPVWGARVSYAPNSEYTGKLGVYQLTKDMFDPSKHGLDFAFRGSDGVSIFAELDRKVDWNGKPGHLAAGANNAFFEIQDFNSPRTTDYFVRFYVQADQQIYQESPGSDQGLVLFLTLAYADQQQVALVPFQTSFGAVYTGPVPGRNDDKLIFGNTYGRLSKDYADQQRALGKGRPIYEMPIELGYRMQLNKFAYIQPDIQYVVHPGGTGNIPNATVIGAQFGAAF
jgi:porin